MIDLAANFFKGLTQNSTRKLKVEIQFYVDSENFMNRTSKTEKMRSMISKALYIKSVFPLSGAKSIEQPRIKSSIKTRYLILQLDQ